MSNEPHILVIDDELQIQRAIRTILTEKGFKVTTASNGGEGLALAAANVPDIIILDLGLPDLDGVEVCSRLREWTQCPIIILSVRDSERDKVGALDAGADDYLTKPFAFEELLARIQALLRRNQKYKTPTLKVGELELNPIERKVSRSGKTISLTGKEYALLEYLMRNKGRIVTQTMIIDHVWDTDYDGFSNVVNVYINHLREKIDKDFSQKYIHTIRGSGYKIDESPEV